MQTQPDNNNTYLTTGVAGFIGYFLSKELLEQGGYIIGIDNMYDYYDVNLKYVRLENLKPCVRYSITNPDAYIESNLVGFFNIIEACRHFPVDRPALLYSLRTCWLSGYGIL